MFLPASVPQVRVFKDWFSFCNVVNEFFVCSQGLIVTTAFMCALIRAHNAMVSKTSLAVIRNDLMTGYFFLIMMYFQAADSMYHHSK